jgi:histidyl-tRNA synthetase
LEIPDGLKAMSKQSSRPKARLPRGFRDRTAAEIAAERAMLDAIRGVYERYGFEALETPAFEYTDALGKFLPDVERPNEGVFSLQDDDEQWMSLRYDLTAPLARYVAENFQFIPKPFRRYQVGTVWRNEKPGPGRFREFTQFDADTVGTAAPSSDAELLMMLADGLEAVGLKRGEYLVKVNSRNLLDGVLEAAGVSLSDAATRGTVLRAIDKLDRLGPRGVEALLGEGRKDGSGDFTKGAGLKPGAIAAVLQFVSSLNEGEDFEACLSAIAKTVAGASGEKGITELDAIFRILKNCGYGPDRMRIDTSIVRGLDYYTGPVFEAQLTFPVANDAGETVVFGSVGSGGRYDDLVARFTGQTVPACGVSIGVSRLLTAIRACSTAAIADPLVVVLVLDKEETASSFRMARELREAGIRAEAYTGESGMKAQMKYADRRGAAIAVIEGSDERALGEITLKDLVLGAELAKSVGDRAEWVKEQPAQISVKREALVASIRAMLDERKG